MNHRSLAIAILSVCAIIIAVIAFAYVISSKCWYLYCHVNSIGYTLETYRYEIPDNIQLCWAIGSIIPVLPAVGLIVGALTKRIKSISLIAINIAIISILYLIVWFIYFYNPMDLLTYLLAMLLPNVIVLIASILGISDTRQIKILGK